MLHEFTFFDYEDDDEEDLIKIEAQNTISVFSQTVLRDLFECIRCFQILLTVSLLFLVSIGFFHALIVFLDQYESFII